jgi:hypothetical protein
MLRTLALVLFIFSITTTQTIQAQINDTPVFSYHSLDVNHSEVLARQSAPKMKSETMAYLYSAANVIIPMGLGYLALDNDLEAVGAALMLYGGIIGPSFGNYYADDWRVGNTGTIIRGVVLGIYATSQLSGTNQVTNGPEVIMYASIAAFAGTALYNVLNIPNSVERHNRRARFPGRFDMGPSVDASTGSPLLRASLTF